ncbi:hypothetical protein GN244_ATG16387 [Phytophthora infestans]|uniref:Uncharacterized protein n=1 Tax=Phytophthora infestans TaxID=4787 RepID=A0A833WMG3_PHYIN|nr:hypothetical protein GN244_ATG16387 [Phytophthora infestans]KAF4146441.1 hypothetical protein GN958_ATG04370 [Phytophthora infestans]
MMTTACFSSKLSPSLTSGAVATGVLPDGRWWPQSRQKAADEFPNGIRHLPHEVIGVCNEPLTTTVDLERVELADASDIAKGDGCPNDAPDNETIAKWTVVASHASATPWTSSSKANSVSVRASRLLTA